jgi:2-hydroxychromene-2-carboxylate isomerase
MKRLVFWFDPISPFAWLAFDALPQVLEGLSYSVAYRPVLLGALLQHHGSKGPAEIEAKRQWTMRHVRWLAQRQGLRLELPAQHPFNPLPLLRLAQACAVADADGAGPNRRVVEALFRHVWEGGGDVNDPARLAALRAELAPARDPDDPDVAAALKVEVRAATEAAVAAGVFGVPSFGLGGRVFWGLDALPMLRAALEGEAWFDGPDWDAAAAPRPGIVRNG